MVDVSELRGEGASAYFCDDNNLPRIDATDADRAENLKLLAMWAIHKLTVLRSNSADPSYGKSPADDVTLVDARSHPSSGTRRVVARDNIGLLANSILKRIASGRFNVRGPVAGVDADFNEHAEDLLKAVHALTLKL